MPQAAPPDKTWDLGFTFAPVVQPPAAGEGDDAPLKFSAVAYSGGVVLDYGWLGDIAIDLATLKNPDGEVPVLTDHARSIETIAGHGRLSVLADAQGQRQLQLAGQLTRATPAGQRVAQLLREGFPIQMSVGLSAKLREADGTEQINGRQVDVEHVFEHATVREVSFVPVGADSNTRAAAFSFSASEAPASATGSKESIKMARTAEDQALLDTQAAEIAQLKAQIAEAETARKAAATAARKAALSALFKDVGKEAPADDKAAPYLEMSDAAFEAFAADLRAVKAAQQPGRRQADPALFASQTAGRQGDAGNETGSRAALLSAAVKNLIKA